MFISHDFDVINVPPNWRRVSPEEAALFGRYGQYVKGWWLPDDCPLGSEHLPDEGFVSMWLRIVRNVPRSALIAYVEVE
jgi:hypothetical protein